MALTGQTLTHMPQPEQVSGSNSIRRVVSSNWSDLVGQSEVHTPQWMQASSVRDTFWENRSDRDATGLQIFHSHFIVGFQSGYFKASW